MNYLKAMIEQAGTLDDVKIVEATALPLTDGEVRVRMLHAPIRHADLNLMAGNYGESLAFPFTPGGEGSGEVIESRHADFAQGDLVIPIQRLAGGTWSEIWQDSGALFYKVERLDAQQAATLRVNPLSGLLMLERFSGHGQVLINAGNSHVGQCLIAIADSKGIAVVVTVRSEQARELLLEKFSHLKPSQVLLDEKASEATLTQLADEAPFTLALNAVGGESALRQLNHLAEGGTQITYGAMSGKPTRTLASHLIFKNLTLKGFWLQTWTKSVSREEICEKLTELEAMDLPLVATDGRLGNVSCGFSLGLEVDF